METNIGFGSTLTIKLINNDLVGIYSSAINSVPVSERCPKENLIFIDEYQNIKEKIETGYELIVTKDYQKNITAKLQKRDYKNQYVSFGKSFFEVLESLDNNLEKKIINRPKLLQKLIKGVRKNG